MKATLHLIVGFAIALIFFFAIHKLVGPEISPEPTPKGIFSIEIAVLSILLGSVIAAEIRGLGDPNRPYEPRFRNIFFLLVAFLGSGGVFVLLAALLGRFAANGKI